MHNQDGLSGKTIVLTGSNSIGSIDHYIVEHGGRALRYPLIETREVLTEADGDWLQRLSDYEWLIFTSQNAVKFFIEKLSRAGLTAFDLHNQIAAVGEKTADLLKQASFPIQFMPSVYSADYFVQEFRGTGNLLFVRGSLAKATIAEGLGADEWTVYETVPTIAHCAEIISVLQADPDAIVVFASPSAVDLFAEHVATQIGWLNVRCASIGHITTEALARYGVTPIVQPKTYTMKSVITQIILEEWSK